MPELSDRVVSLPQPTRRRGAPLRARHLTWLVLVVFGVVMWRVPFALSNGYQLRVATLLLVYAILTVSVEIVMGRAGQVSLGHGGFFAIGAYCEAILQTRAGVSPWMALLAAVALGAVFGTIVGLPALRVAGPYLAVVTIGFGLTVTALLYVLPGLTQGASGISGTKPLESLGLGDGLLGSYYGAMIVLLVVLVAMVPLGRGNVGLALRALCDRPTLARATGVDVRLAKLALFAGSAAVAAAGGAVYGTLGYLSPDTFTIQLSIFPVVALVLGGMGRTSGAVIGAFALYGFDQAASPAAQGQALLYGGLLMAVPLLLPMGITGLALALLRRLRSRPALERSPATDPAPLASLRLRRPGGRFTLEGLERSFGSVRAVSDVSIDIRAGEVVGLVGPNGSGKSTLLNMASGYYAPGQGRVLLDGVDVTSLPMHRRARDGILPTFQTAQLMDTRSIADNIAVGDLARSRWGRRVDRQQLAALIDALGVDIPLDVTAGGLPEGTRKIVEVGRTLLAQPRVLLLDEPTAGLSTHEVDILVGIVQTVRDAGVTILVADHNVEFIAGLCERIVVLESGQVLSEGSPTEVRADERVIEAYLGSSVA